MDDPRADDETLSEKPRDDAHEGKVDLTGNEKHQVEKRESPGARVVHEVIRRQGDEELKRPALSLMWSGFAAGIAISASVLGQALLIEHLPDAPWRPLVASFGYTLGFLIVILSRLQLFTESTLSAVIPVATELTPINLARIARLWGIVFTANLAGTFLIAWLTVEGWIGIPDQLGAQLAVARHALDHPPLEVLTAGAPAGFLMAAVAWALPSARGQEFFVVLTFTYFIALGGFAHVVAGSSEAWLLLVAGEITPQRAVLGFIVPALIGNVIGGTGLFALLAHAQVRHEL
jgi:formate/nitrite transporter FocA (FNT family)